MEAGSKECQLFWREAQRGQKENPKLFWREAQRGQKKKPKRFGGKMGGGALAGRVPHKIIVITFFLKDKRYRTILRYHMVLGRVCN